MSVYRLCLRTSIYLKWWWYARAVLAWLCQNLWPLLKWTRLQENRDSPQHWLSWWFAQPEAKGWRCPSLCSCVDGLQCSRSLDAVTNVAEILKSSGKQHGKGECSCFIKTKQQPLITGQIDGPQSSFLVAGWASLPRHHSYKARAGTFLRLFWFSPPFVFLRVFSSSSTSLSSPFTICLKVSLLL